MQLDYAIEGYWLAKRRDFSANTVNDHTLMFKRLTEFVCWVKTRFGRGSGRPSCRQGNVATGCRAIPARCDSLPVT